MLKLKRVWLLIMVFLCSTAAIGWSAPKVGPEETVKIYANMAIKSDFSELGKLGFSEEEQKMAVQIKEKAFEQNFALLFSQFKTQPNAAANAKLKNAILKLAQKTVIQTETVFMDDTSATVKVSILAVDQNDFINKTFVPTIHEKFGDPNFKWSEEGANVIAALYDEASDPMPMQSMPTTFSVKCVIDKKRECWRPEMPEAFKKLLMAATGGM